MHGGGTLYSVSGWTINTLAAHLEALRIADERFQAERDRRYTDVALEKEKALKIKEEADRAALGLAREIQTYKDEKANELREQISSERGLYATKGDLTAATDKIEATLKPIAEYVQADRGRGAGVGLSWAIFVAAAGLLVAFLAIFLPHVRLQ
jgi:hypothetical protein